MLTLASSLNSEKSHIFVNMHDKKKQSLHSDLIDKNQSRYCADADFDFDSICLNSYRGLCAYACRYVDIATAEEIVQDTMMWLWDNRQTIIPGKSVGALLLRIVHNKAVNQIKHNAVFTKVHKQIENNLREQFENPDVYLSTELSELLPDNNDIDDQLDSTMLIDLLNDFLSKQKQVKLTV